MVGKGPAAHQVWLPPLDVPDTLDQLMPDLAVDPRLGLVSPASGAGSAALTVPLGTVDRPREQRRDPLSVDLPGRRPRRRRRRPAQRQEHAAALDRRRAGADPTPAGVAVLRARLRRRHVRAAGRPAARRRRRRPAPSGTSSRRIVAEVQGIVDRREAYFRADGHRLDRDLPARRARPRTRAAPTTATATCSWSSTAGARCASDFDDLEMAIQQLATRGLTFGLHIVAAASRWSDFRAAMRDLFGTRLELRLGDPIDSEIDRRVAALVPAGRPGRGLVAGKLHFLGALPRIDGDRRRRRPRRRRRRPGRQGPRRPGPGPAGPKLRLLPARIDLDEVREQAGARPRTGSSLGIDEKDLAPVAPRPAARAAPAGPRRRRLGQERRAAHLRAGDHAHPDAGAGPDPARRLPPRAAGRGARGLPARLRDLRRPGDAGAARDRDLPRGPDPRPDVTPEQLRDRSWWTGAELFVLVDDYDLVATQQSSPVAALQPLLAQARDVGLHLAVARRSGGASRALYEPVIQSLRDLAMPGPDAVRQPRRGSAARQPAAVAAPARPRPAGHPRPRRRGRPAGLGRALGLTVGRVRHRARAGTDPGR